MPPRCQPPAVVLPRLLLQLPLLLLTAARCAAAGGAGAGGVLPHITATQAVLDCFAGPGRWVRDQASRAETSDAYAWVPARDCGAPFERWSRRAFCDALDGRSLLIVGDSLNSQLAEALTFGGPPRRRLPGPGPKRRNGQRLPIGWDATICVAQRRRARLYYRRNDYLSLDGEPRSGPALLERDWSRHVLPRADIVLLNRGAHWQPTPQFLEGYAAALAAVGAARPGALVFVRTTPAGHVDCHRHRGPLREPPSRTGRLPYPFSTYHWPEVEAQNDDVRVVLFGGHGGNGSAAAAPWRTRALLLDVLPSSVLRPDAHIAYTLNPRDLDCLHWRRGRVVTSSWARLLLNALLLERRLAGSQGGV